MKYAVNPTTQYTVTDRVNGAKPLIRFNDPTTAFNHYVRNAKSTALPQLWITNDNGNTWTAVR